MAIENIDYEFLTSQTPRTTPEIMEYIKKLFSSNLGRKGTYTTGTTANLQKMYDMLRKFDYEDWVKGVQGGIKKADITSELEELKGIPGNLLQEYEQVLLPEFEQTTAQAIKEKFSRAGLQGSAYANEISDAYANLFRGAQSEYLQSRADVGQQAVQYGVGAETDYTAAMNQALVQLMSGQPGFMQGLAGIAGQLDTAIGATQERKLDPMAALLAQLAQGFDPFNTMTVVKPKPPPSKVVQRKSEHLVTGPPISFGGTSTMMPGSFI